MLGFIGDGGRHHMPHLNLYLQKNVRTREVLLSRISVYIVVLMVSCHTVRIIPNIWEIVQTLNMDIKAQVGDIQTVDMIIMYL